MNSSNQSFWNGSPKTMFFMGLFLGLAVSATIGLAGVVGYIASGKSVAAVAATQPVAQQPTNPTPTQPDPTPVAKLSKPVDATRDHIRGPKDAKVTLVEYSDFECPFCKAHAPTIDAMLKKYPKDVRLVYRHYPLSFHPNAQPAAIAAECVAKLAGEDAFWKMHDQLFDKSPNIGADVLKSMATGLGVKEADYTKCFDNKETLPRVNEDVASGNDSGVQGTPATFVNNQFVSGAVPLADFEQVVVAAGAKN